MLQNHWQVCKEVTFSVEWVNGHRRYNRLSLNLYPYFMGMLIEFRIRKVVCCSHNFFQLYMNRGAPVISCVLRVGTIATRSVLNRNSSCDQAHQAQCCYSWLNVCSCITSPVRLVTLFRQINDFEVDNSSVINDMPMEDSQKDLQLTF